MVSEKELQEKMLIYRTLESRLGAFAKQSQLLTEKIGEIAATVLSIEEVEKNRSKVLFKLGSESYIQGKISGDTILVEVGAGVILEKQFGEAKQILFKRRGELEYALREVQKNVLELSNAMSRLAPEINEMIKGMQHSAAG